MRKIAKWLPSLHDPGPARLWRIGYALAACFVIAVAGLAGLWLAARALLGNPHITTSKGISVHDTVGVAQLVFASVAGAGALVALVVAYRRQRVAEVTTVEDKDRWEATAAHDRTRVFNERFTAIATQLGDDQPAVRLAGVHAMAGLADDWAENRQTCVDVLCAYLRLPYDPDPGDDAEPDEPAAERAKVDQAAYRANREVRHTIIRLIGAHLRPGAAVSWQGRNLDFTGVVFDGGNFSGAEFSGGRVSFTGAEFSGGEVSFDLAKFSGGTVDFSRAKFSGATVDFRAKFSGGTVDFRRVNFSGATVNFGGVRFSGGKTDLADAESSGGIVDLADAEFYRGTVDFRRARFSGGKLDFRDVNFSGATVNFSGAMFSGGKTDLAYAEIHGGTVDLAGAKSSGATVNFSGAKFSAGTVDFAWVAFSGGKLDFSGAKFSGGTVDFHRVASWRHPPDFGPGFDMSHPPAGVMMPTAAGPSPDAPVR